MKNIPVRAVERAPGSKRRPRNVKRFVVVGAFLAGATSLALVGTRAIGQTPASATKAAAKGAVAGPAGDAHKLVDTYCIGCHNSRAKIGGLVLQGLDLQASASAPTWEKALRKLRGHLMPPPGSPQPPAEMVENFTSYMEHTIDAQPHPITAGYVPIQRLNRTEYATAVKALIGVDVNEKDILPQDVQVEGLDNIAEALTTSPAFLDQYISAARHIAKMGVGNMAPPISSWTFSPGGNQDPELPFPPGIRNAMQFTHNFPADGDYRLSTAFDERSIGLYNAGLQNRTTQVVMIDGKVVFKGDIGGMEDLRLANVKGTDGWATILSRFQKIPVKVTAGPHLVTIGFIERSHVESDDNVGGGGGRGGGAPVANLPAQANNAIEIKGPYNPTGITNSTTRPMIFVCDPKVTGETACAKQIAQNLARRAYGRPVTEADVTTLMRFYDEGRLDKQPFDKGVEQIVAAVLASPDFLYRSIRGLSTAPKTTEHSLTDRELAKRLSFFIWNTPPDDTLVKLAESGSLSKPGVLDAQVKRMIADPKASSLVSSFAMKWLNLNSLDSVQPDPKIFAGFDMTLRRDFQTEAEMFLGSILLKDRSVVELLTSNQTYMNNRLARHYGINNGPTTSAFKPVTLTDQNRFGLLGKAAVLMRTSYGDRTSPVLRGAWVLDKIIGAPPSPPPPTVVTNLDQKPGETPKTVRARLEQHRDQASCKMCHGVIDPTGLALENFDAVGQYRTTDRQAGNAKIDASTVMASGVAINGPVELRAALASNPENFVRTMTERLMMYSVNRPLEYFDMPQIRKVVRDAKKDNYTLEALVLGIAKTDAFRKQGPLAVTKAAPKTVGAAAPATKASAQPTVKQETAAAAAKPLTR